MEQMKTLTFPDGTTYEIVDEEARLLFNTQSFSYKRRLTSADDLDTMFGSEYTGIYTFNTGNIPQNCAFQNGGTIEISGTEVNGTRQTVTRYGATAQSKTRIYYNGSWQKWNDCGLLVEDETYAGCYYRMVNNVQEWENPPLIGGVEYATTERHKGKAVYVKLVDIGTLPSNTSKQVVYSKNPATCVKIEVVVSNSGGTTYLLPFITSTGDLRTAAQVTKYNIILNTFSDLSSYSGIAKIWYTKD